MASVYLHRSSHQHTSAVGCSSSSAQPSAAKSPQRYYRVDAGWESSRAIYALAADTGLSHSEAVLAWMRANTYCVHVPVARNGRFDFTTADDLAAVCRLPHSVNPHVFLQSCIRHGFVRSRYGKLYNVGFKERYSVPWEHQRADALQAEEQRQHKLIQKAGYERDRRSRRSEDRLEMQGCDRMPSCPPIKPPVLSLVLPQHSPTHHPTHAPKSLPKKSDGLANERIKMNQAADLADRLLEPDSAQPDPRTTPNITPRGAYNGSISPPEPSCGGQQRIQSIGSLPALPVCECKPPSSSASLNEDQEGGEHVRLNQGEAERSPQTAERLSQTVKSHCAEGKGTPDAGSEADTPQQPVTAPVMPSTPQFGQSMPPADFSRHVRALFACRAASADIMAVFKERMGTDWKIVEQLLGPTPASELNKMDDRLREQSLGMLISRHMRDYRRQEATRPAPKTGGEQLLASLGVKQPTADGPPPAPPALPPRDSLPAIIERVCGHRAAEVYVGPDLVRRVKKLPVSPEQVELAFKESAQRPPAKFSSLGWAALTRLERVAGLKPALEGGD